MSSDSIEIYRINILNHFFFHCFSSIREKKRVYIILLFQSNCFIRILKQVYQSYLSYLCKRKKLENNEERERERERKEICDEEQTISE